jgi:hypothetical protein
MMWTWAFAAMTFISTPVPQEPAAAPPLWRLSARVAAPMTTTDPNHVTAGLGLARTGAYRMSAHYQPSENSALGGIQATMGFRLLRRQSMDLSFDLDYSQVWADRPLFRGVGWQLNSHDRRRVSLGALSIQLKKRRFLGLVEGVEVGAGRMYIRRLVSANAGTTPLSQDQDAILISSGPVGMVGVRLYRPLFWGLKGAAHARVIGAGRSRGGELPFAHLTSDWSVTKSFGRAEFGVAGNHATSPRAATYFQNGLGLTLRIAF